jgi:hypothetical protein
MFLPEQPREEKERILPPSPVRTGIEINEKQTFSP